MTQVLSKEEFEHFHLMGMKNLEIDSGWLASEKTKTPALGALDSELASTLEEILTKLSDAGRRGPDEVFKRAFSSLDSLDVKRFLIENLLEATKRNEDLSKTLTKYKNIGLIRTEPTPAAANPPQNVGELLVQRKSFWKRVTTTVLQIATNAFKSIPKWVEIEPQVTFVGPIPMISFSLRGKGMSIHDLFETLRGDS